jgi:hypothetical protein
VELEISSLEQRWRRELSPFIRSICVSQNHFSFFYYYQLLFFFRKAIFFAAIISDPVEWINNAPARLMKNEGKVER